MSGATIPDDWDGSTLECLKIQWPASVQWRAILLGQISEPAVDRYWDPGSGDPAPAALAAGLGYVQTIDQISLECDDILPAETLPPSWFLAQLKVDQAIPNAIWTDLILDNLAGFGEKFGYVTGLHAHIPDALESAGIWHYDVTVSITVLGQFYVRLISSSKGVIARGHVISEDTIQFSHVADVRDPSEQIKAQIFTVGGKTVNSVSYLTQWSGHWLGSQV